MIIKKRKTKYQYKEDRKMRNYGDIDFEKKKIRINTRKGDVMNTIIHEEIHKQHPDWSEKKVREEALKREKKMTLKTIHKKIKKVIKLSKA